jgi:hypothetical protein
MLLTAAAIMGLSNTAVQVAIRLAGFGVVWGVRGRRGGGSSGGSVARCRTYDCLLQRRDMAVLRNLRSELAPAVHHRCCCCCFNNPYDL